MAVVSLDKTKFPEEERKELRVVAQEIVKGKKKITLTSFIHDFNRKLNTVLREEFGVKGNIQIVNLAGSKYEVVSRGGLKRIDKEKARRPAIFKELPRPAPAPQVAEEVKVTAEATPKELEILARTGKNIEEASRKKNILGLYRARGQLIRAIQCHPAEQFQAEARTLIDKVNLTMTGLGVGIPIRETVKAPPETEIRKEEAPKVDLSSTDPNYLVYKKQDLRREMEKLREGDPRKYEIRHQIYLIDGRLSQFRQEDYYNEHYIARKKEVPLYPAPRIAVKAEQPEKVLKKRGPPKKERPLQLLSDKEQVIVLTPKESKFFNQFLQLESKGTLTKAELARVTGIAEKSIGVYLFRLRKRGLPVSLVGERAHKPKKEVQLRPVLTKAEVKRELEEHGMPIHQLTNVLRDFVKRQGLAIKDFGERDRYLTMRGRILRSDLKRARGMSKATVTGLEHLGLSKRMLSEILKEGAGEVRKRTEEMEKESKAVLRRPRRK